RPLQTSIENIASHSGADICVGVSLGGKRSFFSRESGRPRAPSPVSQATRVVPLCLIKPLCSLVVLSLYRDGTLDLDSPIAAYLPEFRGTSRGERVTLGHLISHTGGYTVIEPSRLDASGTISLYRRILAARQLFSPGDVFSYQNANFVLVAD